MSDITVKALTGGQYYFLPDFQNISLGFEFGDVGAASIDYPVDGVNADKLGIDTVLIAYSDGVEMPDARWHIQAGSGAKYDDVPVTQWIGKSVIDATRRVVVLPDPDSPTGAADQRFDESTPGVILGTLFAQAQTRGAFLGFSWDFTDTLDSDGVPWEKQISITYRVGTKYLDVMRNLVDQGMIEFRLEGMTIRAFNVDGGMAVDRSVGPGTIELVAGRDYAEMPWKATAEDRAKFAAVVGDDQIVLQRTNAAAVDGPFGREEMSISQGGTKDLGTLALVGDNNLERVAVVREEFTRQMILHPDAPVPCVDFMIGDWIRDRVEATSERYRVRSIVVTISESNERAASIVLNDKLLEQEIRIARRVNGIIGGASVDGGGNGLPTDTTEDQTIPNPPVALDATSEAYINAYGHTRVVARLQWSPPTTNTDGSPISDLMDFEVNYKPSSAPEWSSTTTGMFSLTISDLEPNTDYDFRVRTRDTTAHLSSWAVETHRTATDDAPPPVPSAPIVTETLGALNVAWDGKGSAGQDMPVDFRAVEVHRSVVNNFTPTAATLVTSISYAVPTAISQTGLGYGTTYYYRFVAVDQLGNKSGPSAQTAGVPRKVVGSDIEPGSISTGEVDFDASDLGAQTTYFGPSAPATPNTDDLWIDYSDNNILKRWDGSQWLEVDDERIALSLINSESAAASAQAAQQQATDAYNKAQAAETTATNAANDAGDALDQVGIMQTDLDQKVQVFWQSTEPAGRTETDVNDIWIDTDDGKTYLWTWDTVAGAGSWAQTEDDRIGEALTAATNAENKVDTKVTVFFQDTQPAVTGRTTGDMWYETDNQNKPYRWSGTAWEAYQLGAPAISATARQLGSITTYFQTSEPASGMLLGDLWIDIDDFNKVYRYDGSSWLEADDQRIDEALIAAGGAQATADGKIRTYVGTAEPAGTAEEPLAVGDLWVDTDDDNKLHRYNGASWIQIDDARISAQASEISELQGDLTAAQAAISTTRAIADGLITTFYQASPPAGASEGDVWVDTDDSNASYRLDGADAWQPITDTRITDALNNAAAAAAAADGKIKSYWQASEPTGGDYTQGDLWFETDNGNKAYWYNGSNFVAVPFGGGALQPGSLSQENLVPEIRAALGQIFHDDFSDTSRWEAVTTPGSSFAAVDAADSKTGGKVGRFTNGINAYRVHRALIPYDPSQLYRVTVRVRENPASAGARFYAGVMGVAADGSTKVNYQGTDSQSSQFYVAATSADVGGSWAEYVGYIKGSAAVGSPSAAPDPKDPAVLHQDVRYIRPLMIFNYGGVSTDIMEVDLFKLEAVPTGLVERQNIQTAAINTALIEDGAIISAKIGDAQVTTAKIDDLAVNDAKIANLNGGKIEAETIDVSSLRVGVLSRNLVRNPSFELTELDINGDPISPQNGNGWTAEVFEPTTEIKTRVTGMWDQDGEGNLLPVSMSGEYSGEIKITNETGSAIRNAPIETFTNLVLNPSAEGYEDATTTRTNLVRNPSFETSTGVDYLTAYAVGTQSSGLNIKKTDEASPIGGETSLEVGANVGGGTGDRYGFWQDVPGITPGKQYYYRGWFRTDVWPAGKQAYFYCDWLTAGGVWIASATAQAFTTTAASPTWRPFEVLTTAAPSTAGILRIYAWVQGDGTGKPQATTKMRVDGLSVVDASAGYENYFDGYTIVRNGNAHSWSGTANTSASITKSANTVPARTNQVINPRCAYDSAGWSSSGSGTGSRINLNVQLSRAGAFYRHTGDTTATEHVIYAATSGFAAGDWIAASVWVRSNVSTTVNLKARSKNSSNSYTYYAIGSVAVPANTWTLVSGVSDKVIPSGYDVQTDLMITSYTNSVVLDATLACAEKGKIVGKYFDGSAINYALGSKVTVSSGTVQLGADSTYDPSRITDGDTNYNRYYNASTGLQSVTVDMGTVWDIDLLNIRHYSADGRTYHSTKTEVSVDGANWYTVFDSAVSGEYAESPNGKWIVFSIRKVRYIRDWLNGSTANTGNHWIGIEAYLRQIGDPSQLIPNWDEEVMGRQWTGGFHASPSQLLGRKPVHMSPSRSTLYQAASPVGTIGTNYVPNPSFEAGLDGWASGPAVTLTQLSIYDAPAGAYVAEMTKTTNTPGNAYTVIDVAGLTVGASYRAIVSLRRVGAEPLDIYIRNDADNGRIEPGNIPLEWAEYTFTYTATSTNDKLFVANDAGAQGSTVQIDAVAIVPAGVSYFDGDYGEASWNGTPHASTSTLVDSYLGICYGQTVTDNSSSWGGVYAGQNEYQPVTAGTTYTALVDAYFPDSAPVDLRVQVSWYDASAVQIGYNYVVSQPGVLGLNHGRGTVVAPAGATQARVYFRPGGDAPPNGTRFYWSGLSLVEGDYDGPGFSGNTEDTGDWYHTWTGAPYQSTSIRETQPWDAVRNLVTNPSFEVGTDNWVLDYGHDTTTPAYLVGDAAPGGGSTSIERTGTVSDDFNRYFGVYTDIDTSVEPGDVFEFRAWTKLPDGMPDGMELFFHADYTVDGVAYSAMYSRYSANRTFDTTDWVETVFKTRPAPAGASTLRLYVLLMSNGNAVGDHTGRFRLDNVAVTKMSLPGYFDGSTPDSNTTRYSWDGTFGLSSSTRTVGTPVGGQLVSDPIEIESGKDYYLTAFYRVSYYLPDGVYASVDTWEDGVTTPEPLIDGAQMGGGGTSVWQQVAGRATVPTTHNRARVRLGYNAVYADNEPNWQYIWFDDVALVKAGFGAAELSSNGLRLFDADGDLTVNLSALAEGGNFVEIKDGGATRVNITRTGDINAQSLSVAGDLSYKGESLDSRFNRIGRGLIYYGSIALPDSELQNRVGMASFNVELEEGRAYRIYTIGPYFKFNGTANLAEMNMYLNYAYESSVTTSSPAADRWIYQNPKSGAWRIHDGSTLFYPVDGTGNYQFGLAMDCVFSGTATAFSSIAFAVEDIGLAVPSANIVVDRMGGSLYQAPPPPPPPTTKTYTKRYTATWSGTYQGNNSFISYYGNEALQGQSPSSWGNMKSFIGFNDAQIRSDLAGASINYCNLYLYANHWWYNDGGTAVIGTHNWGSRPGSASGAWYDRIRSANWPKPGGRWVGLGTGIGKELRDGATRGVTLGPGPSTSGEYYGRINGAGMANPPQLEIQYVK